MKEKKLKMKLQLKIFLYYLLLFTLYSGGIIYGLNNTWSSKKCTETHYKVCLAIKGMKVIWLFSFPYLLLVNLGLLLFPAVNKKKFNPISYYEGKFNDTLHFRYVTTGKQRNLVITKVSEMYKLLLEKMGNIKWVIDVVTDIPLNLSEVNTIHTKNNRNNRINNLDMYIVRDEEENEYISRYVDEIVVPENYITTNNTLFKGRALEYASNLEYIGIHDWIHHLDEESTFDERTLEGLLNHINKYNCEKKEHQRIGQGPIIYGPDNVKGLQQAFLTGVDFCRVTDSYGKFRIQYEFGTCLFGMQGSHYLIRNDVEKEISYDHGYESCIAEDTFFAMIGREKGYKYDFIDACVYENSPFTILQLWKQRRRWINGLWKICLSSQIMLKTKILLLLMVFTWSILGALPMIFTLFYIPFNIYYPTNEVEFYNGLLGINFSLICVVYIMGFLLSHTPTIWVDKIGIYKYIIFTILNIICIPLYTLTEGCAVLYWMITSLFCCTPINFEVVTKERDYHIELAKKLTSIDHI